MNDNAFLNELSRRLSDLRRRQLIDDGSHARLAHYCADTAGGLSVRSGARVVIFLSVLGALLMGGGMVLLVAHSWDEYSPDMRLMMGFLPLILSGILGLYTLARAKSQVWNECSAVLTAAGSACAIAVAAQVYHQGGTLADFLFVWLLLNIPTLFLFRSHAWLLGYTGAFVCYVAQSFFSAPADVLLPLLLALPVWIVGVYFFKRPKFDNSSSFASLAGITAGVFCLIGWGRHLEGMENRIVWSAFVTILLMLGTLRRRRNRMNLLYLSGFTGMAIILILNGFSSSWRYRSGFSMHAESALWVVFLLPLLVAVLMGARVFVRRHYLEFASTLCLFVPLALFGVTSAWYAALAFNAATLVIGILFFRIGAKRSDLWQLNLGMILLSALAVARIFGSDFDMFYRAIICFVLGAVFLGINLLQLRVYRRKGGVL